MTVTGPLPSWSQKRKRGLTLLPVADLVRSLARPGAPSPAPASSPPPRPAAAPKP